MEISFPVARIELEDVVFEVAEGGGGERGETRGVLHKIAEAAVERLLALREIYNFV